jgi:hypothetical protein
MRPYVERAGGVAQNVALSSNPVLQQHCKKKKKSQNGNPGEYLMNTQVFITC